MKEKNEEFQVLAESARDLWLVFERHLDPGLFETATRKHQTGGEWPTGWRFLGEGADQTAVGRTCGGVNYAMSIPKATFLEASRDEGRAWLDDLDLLRAAARHRAFDLGGKNLVPPMHVSKKPAAIIMPEGRVTGVLPREAWDNTLALLEGLGLVLGDRPQVAVWRGYPFIYDWSDLRRVSRR